MTTYVLSENLTEEESTRRFHGNQLRHLERPEPGFYKFAIRRDGERGWVFRFPSVRDVGEILSALNGDVVEAAA